jgi:hypothetical protein
MLDQTAGIPGLRRGELGGTLLNAGKGLIAYDEWGKDPARAAGTAFFNIASAVVGTKGASAALDAAGEVAETSEVAGTAARLGGEATGELPAVSDAAAVRLFDQSVQDGLKDKLENPATRNQFPPGYDPLHGLSVKQYLDKYSTGFDPDGKPRWNWDKEARDGGAVRGTVSYRELSPGETIDRYGPPKGKYLSPAGTPFPERSLPASSMGEPYYQYKVLRPLPVEESVVAPAFGEPGWGIQYALAHGHNVDWYVHEGYLEEIHT